MEVRFFPGGTVHIHSLWEDDGNSYSETGIYTYSPSSGRLKIVFDPEVSSMEISSYVGGRPAAFYTGGIAMVRREEPVLPEKPIPLEALIGPWVMYYQFIGELEVELVEVTLDLKASGLFVETTRYFEADEDLVESGRYEIDRRTGLVEFYYSTNPDYGYTAYYDTRRKALYTFDGDYYRTE